MTQREPIFDRVIHPKDLRSSRRLLSRLIVDYQKGKISGQALRDLGPYMRLLIEYDEKIDLIKRVEALEKLRGKE